MKRYIRSTTDQNAVTVPDGGDGKNYSIFYAGPGYASYNDVVAYAKQHGFKYILWGSDEALGYKGAYNGDSYIIYNDANSLPAGMSYDAEKHGQGI